MPPRPNLVRRRSTDATLQRAGMEPDRVRRSFPRRTSTGTALKAPVRPMNSRNASPARSLTPLSRAASSDKGSAEAQPQAKPQEAPASKRAESSSSASTISCEAVAVPKRALPKSPPRAAAKAKAANRTPGDAARGAGPKASSSGPRPKAKSELRRPGAAKAKAAIQLPGTESRGLDGSTKHSGEELEGAQSPMTPTTPILETIKRRHVKLSTIESVGNVQDDTPPAASTPLPGLPDEASQGEEESPIDSAVGHVTTCFSSWRQLSLGSLSSGGLPTILTHLSESKKGIENEEHPDPPADLASHASEAEAAETPTPCAEPEPAPSPDRNLPQQHDPEGALLHAAQKAPELMAPRLDVRPALVINIPPGDNNAVRSEEVPIQVNPTFTAPAGAQLDEGEYRLLWESVVQDSVRDEGSNRDVARVEQRVLSLEEGFNTFKELTEQQQKAQRTLVDMQIDSAKRDLELGIRSLRQQNHAELFQEAERVAIAAVGKGVRESLATEVASLHRVVRQMNDSVDERLRIFEQRLNGMESRFSQGLEQSLHQLEELEFRFSNDSSRLSPELAQQLPDFVKSWGHGRFRSQNELVTYVDVTMTDVHGSLNQAMQTVKGEIQEMLKVASEGMGSRIEEVVNSKTLSIENRLTSTDMMLSNVLAKQAKEAEASQEKHPKRTVSDAKECTGQDEADAKVLEGKGQDGPNDMKSWLNKQISGITGDAQVQSHNLEGAELLSWMKKHVNELVTDLLPATVGSPSPPSHEDASPKDTPLSLDHRAREVASFPTIDWERLDRLEQNLTNFAANLNDLETARLPGRLALLEGACLEERLALLESYNTGGVRSQPQPGLPLPSPQGTSQLLALREELQRLRNRVALVEGLVQIPEVENRQDQTSDSPRSPRLADMEVDENFKSEMMNLWRAVSGDQRTLDLLSSKLEDAVRNFSKMQSRFEAAMPQMLQLLGELLKGAGTGDTGESPQVDVLLAMQKLLYGGESGMPFVSPAALRETFNSFEAMIRSEMEKLRDELLREFDDKAPREDVEFLAEQLRLWQGQLQMLWQSFEKLLNNEPEVDAAIWRKPLTARCVSCDRKVDIKGMLFDRDTPFLPTGANSPSPNHDRHERQERAQSARRGQQQPEENKGSGAGDIQMLQEFINRGRLQSGRLCDMNGHSIFWNALAYQQQQVAMFLLHHFPPGSAQGIDLWEVHQRRKDTLLHLCVYFQYFSAPVAELFEVLCLGMGQVDTNSFQAYWNRANADSDTFLHCAAARRNFWVIRYVASHAGEILFQRNGRTSALEVLLEKLEEVGVSCPTPDFPEMEVKRSWMDFSRYLPVAERTAFADMELEVQQSTGTYRVPAHRCVLGAASGSDGAMGIAPCAGEQLQNCCSTEPLASYPEARLQNGFKEEVATHIVRKHAALEPKFEKTLAQHLATSPAGHAVWKGDSIDSQQSQQSHPSSVPKVLSSDSQEPPEFHEYENEREAIGCGGVCMLLKSFVQETVRGQAYHVLVADGTVEPCKLLLSANLQYFQLVLGCPESVRSGSVIHDVPLKSIKDLCPGKSIQTRYTPVDLDDMCATLVLRNNE
eukprot:s662_g10.t1